MNKEIIRFDPDIFDVYGMAYTNGDNTVPLEDSKIDLYVRCHKRNLDATIKDIENCISFNISNLMIGCEPVAKSITHHPYLSENMRIKFKCPSLFGDKIQVGTVAEMVRCDVVKMYIYNPLATNTIETSIEFIARKIMEDIEDIPFNQDLYTLMNDILEEN